MAVSLLGEAIGWKTGDRLLLPDSRLIDDPPAPYGYCPLCGAPGLTRERRPNGNDRCILGHEYPSRDALKEKPTGRKSPGGAP